MSDYTATAQAAERSLTRHRHERSPTSSAATDAVEQHDTDEYHRSLAVSWFSRSSPVRRPGT
ncbi:MAG: hypothetical protein J07HX64_00012 [halophilic archaeon J07HX64]|nr:MAG: hypothetical protein J07HX64_00012 [halophilic archaeon J07HX64]